MAFKSIPVISSSFKTESGVKTNAFLKFVLAWTVLGTPFAKVLIIDLLPSSESITGSLKYKLLGSSKYTPSDPKNPPSSWYLGPS